MNPIVILLAAAVCGYRLTIEPGLSLADTYKDLAHIFVGGLFGAAFMARTERSSRFRPYILLAVGMTILEVACGVIGKRAGTSITHLLGLPF